MTLSRKRRSARPTRSGLALLTSVAALAALATSASAAIVPKDSADEIAQAIVHDPSTLNLAQTDWHERPRTNDSTEPTPEFAITGAIGNAPFSGFPTSPSTFGLLTTGDPTIADTPNDGDDEGEAVEFEENGDVHGDTDRDVTVLKVGVTVPSGANCLALDYRFLSDEFPEFVNTQYNDAFIAQVDRFDWSTSGSEILKPGDFATNAGGKPVSVNGVGPTSVTEAEAAGTTYDAATGRVTTKTAVTPGAHLVYLSIFDQGDAIYDSAVILDRLAFLNESPSTCKPPEVPVIVPPPPGPPSPTPPPPNDFTIPGGAVTFGNGTATVTIVVPGPGVVTASDAAAGGSSARAAQRRRKSRRKALIQRTRVVAKRAGRVTLKIRPTKAGKKALRKRGRLRTRVRITYKPTGGTARSKTVRLTLKLKRKRGRR
jgi:hypothetical protein